MERDSLVRPSRLALMMVVAVLLALLAAGTASAATPQEIYDDFAADLDLDGTYTQAELEAVLTDPTIAQYGDPDIIDKLKDLISRGDASRDVFPFTGAQMLLILGGGVALVALGLVLRRGRRGESST
jgi:hypothetical protein